MLVFIYYYDFINILILITFHVFKYLIMSSFYFHSYILYLNFNSVVLNILLLILIFWVANN